MARLCQSQASTPTWSRVDTPAKQMAGSCRRRRARQNKLPAIIWQLRHFTKPRAGDYRIEAWKVLIMSYQRAYALANRVGATLEYQRT